MNQHSQRLLIVDEYPLSRIVLRVALAIRGHICTAVGTADEALRCIATFAPTVVILEWSFRNGSGRGLCHQLRARSAACGRTLVVVAVSVLDEPAEFRIHDPVDEYLTKPATVDLIERAFARHLRS